MLIRQPVLRDQKKSDFRYLIEQKKNPLRIRGLVIADDDETSTHQVTYIIERYDLAHEISASNI